MKYKHAGAAIGAGLLVLAAVQSVGARWGWGGAVGAGYGYGGYGYNGYGGTVQGNYLNGLANVVQSAGMANLYNSEAAINYEQARSLDYDNRLKGTETYFTMRRMNKQYREAEKSPPATSEQMFRWAHRDAPKALNSYEFDALTGQINWPLLLRSSAYDQYRNATEEFFHMRAEAPQKLQESNLGQIQETMENWLYDLKAAIKQYKPNDYLKSRKFIESLAAEASK